MNVGTSRKIPFFLLISSSVISQVSAVDVVTHIDNSAGTPFSLWAAAALIGLGMFLYTLQTRTSTAQLESDIAVSVIAWIPLAFTAVTSFAVDRIVSAFALSSGTSYTIIEDHIIYHFDALGILFGALTLVAIINTIRIISLHKALKLQTEMQTARSNNPLS